MSESLQNIFENHEKNIEEFTASLNLPKNRIFTGFSKLDKTTGGLRRKTLFVLGARPSTGKTSLALNFACNQFFDFGYKIIFFSLEMSAETLLERIMSIRLEIEYSKFNKNDLSELEIEEIKQETKKIKDRFIIVDDIYTIEKISETIKEYKPDVCFVDFIQIMIAEKSTESIRGRIDYITSSLKFAAKMSNSVVFALSQITRAGKEAPTMSDLKESGGIEQDGDYIALIHRPYVTDKSRNAAESIFLLDKNKFGSTGKEKMIFDGKYQKFSEA